MKKVIVTGGLGFIGSNLINILKKKYFVINIDKVTYASNFKNIDPDIKNYKFYKQDINNKIFIKKILEKYNPSIIFNLAAETHVDRSIDGPNNLLKVIFLEFLTFLKQLEIIKKKLN
jgi:dTDP-glucose 4,6-dehydratase